MPTSSYTKQKEEKKTDRERLFDGDNAEPRIRTREEIIAKYRKNAGVIAAVNIQNKNKNLLFEGFTNHVILIFFFQDASSIAGEARNKLLERQEKLEV